MKKQNLFSILHLLTPNDRVYIQIALRHFPNGCYRPIVNDNKLDRPIPLHAIPLVDRNTALKCIDGYIDWTDSLKSCPLLHQLRRKLAGETLLNLAMGDYKFP